MIKNVGGWYLSLLVISLLTSNVQAIGISSMLEYTDERGQATFVISNGDGYRQYINTTISELTVVNGEIKKMPYTRENIDKWVLDVRPARSILEPGFKKNVTVQYQPKGIERSDRDRIFRLSFVPTPYFKEGEESHQVKIAFGFAPLLIVPAKETQPLDYDIKYQGDKVFVTNKGNGFFSLYLDGCSKNTPDNVINDCSTSATVIAGRKLEVKLPKEMLQYTELKAKIFSYGNKFKAEAVLTKQ